ncbi:hypothetical protein ACOBQB_33220 [Streptomyces sp. G5(2025)]|uniref:hypothetical protein n=1 Tax=Streptomyces sp. G5(2025) TaxID=3406628 RepID=UPI003C2109FB
MPNERNSEYEVLHQRGTLTPFQEWHNEPAGDAVPELPERDGELSGSDRFMGHNRATRVVRQQRSEFCESDTHPAPAPAETCGFGPPKPARFCMCRRGDHE